jgi:hypothetical protein
MLPGISTELPATFGVPGRRSGDRSGALIDIASNFVLLRAPFVRHEDQELLQQRLSIS